MDAFESSLVITRPVEDVFAFLADLENDPLWRREWVSGTKTSEGPIDVGSRFRLVPKRASQATEYEVTEYEPNQVAAWKSLSGPLPLCFRRSFVEVDGGTKVTIRYEAEFRGLFRLAKSLLRMVGRRALEGDLPNLKTLMES